MSQKTLYIFSLFLPLPNTDPVQRIIDSALRAWLKSKQAIQDTENAEYNQRSALIRDLSIDYIDHSERRFRKGRLSILN